MRALPLILAACLAAPAGAQEAPCGGSFAGFLDGLRKEASGLGYKKRDVTAFFDGLSEDPRTLARDRAQGIFTKPFLDFAATVISENRMKAGAKNAAKYQSVFDRIEHDYGVSRGVLLAFWALETDYGGFQGDFNTANSLATLAHDCRRPELFRPQLLAALELYTRGDFDPDTTTGAWAGEIGMVQMLPEDIIHYGVDGDGDGHIKLKTSAPDALMSGARMLVGLGWRANEPWLQEVVLPRGFDPALSGLETRKTVREWSRMGVAPRAGRLGDSGLQAAIILPQGMGGPAFIAYPNFDVFFEWNQSFTYVTTAAYFATRLEGAPRVDPGSPPPGLGQAEMKALQQKLVARGYDVGDIDGILGAGTRAAVRQEQSRLGLPEDGWPTAELLRRL